jgi:hypothetical protein
LPRTFLSEGSLTRFTKELIMKTKFRLLLLASILVGTALMSTAAQAACTFYCWHVDETTTCCRTFTCQIVC